MAMFLINLQVTSEDCNKNSKECVCAMAYKCKMEKSHDYMAGDIEEKWSKSPIDESESMRKIQNVVESISEGGKTTIKFAISQEKCVSFCNNDIIENGCKYGFQCHVSKRAHTGHDFA